MHMAGWRIRRIECIIKAGTFYGWIFLLTLSLMQSTEEDIFWWSLYRNSGFITLRSGRTNFHVHTHTHTYISTHSHTNIIARTHTHAQTHSLISVYFRFHSEKFQILQSPMLYLGSITIRSLILENEYENNK